MSALPQALPLALAAAFYPPAIIVLILLLTGEHPRRLVFAYFAGAAVMVVSVGVLVLFVVTGAGATQQDSPTLSAAGDILIGAVLIGLAAWAWKRRRRPPEPKDDAASKGRIGQISDRATASVKWSFVLGLLMFLPSPFYLAAIKDIADSGDSATSQLVAVLICGAAVMLFVEIPVIALVLRPEGLQARLKQFEAWLSGNSWALVAALAAVAGTWLLISGIAAL